jgi:hypothetical protein
MGTACKGSLFRCVILHRHRRIHSLVTLEHMPVASLPRRSSILEVLVAPIRHLLVGLRVEILEVALLRFLGGFASLALLDEC